MNISPYKISVGKTAPLIALATLLLLSGCATLLGGNVKGSFACSAPGGTCAPTQVIDDQALGSLVGDSATPASTSQPGQANGFARTALGAPPPLRTNERVLRIVFPPRIDGAGRYRESYAVHAVVAQSAWADRREPNAKAAALVPQADIGLAALAASAPSLALQEDALEAGLDPSGSIGRASTPLSASSKLSPTETSLIVDAKSKVDALFAGQRQRNIVAPIKTIALPTSVSQSSQQTPKPNILGQSSSPPPLKAVVIEPKTARSPALLNAQSSGQATITTRKSANFPGAVDTGGDE